MDHLIRDLPASSRVLDLGSGGGSFDYGSTKSGIVAMDVSFPAGAQEALGRICANSSAIPLRTRSVDLVVCNHTLEHFEQLDSSLSEIDRVLKHQGALWVAVPDARCLDDILYRWVFKGGGHVNQFTLTSLLSRIEDRTGLRGREFKKLFSGFVYLNPPDPERLRHFPWRARWLGIVPAGLLRFALRWGNYLTRLYDRWLPGGLSQYGWAVVFERGENTGPLKELESDVNVCFRCGAGHPGKVLAPKIFRRRLWRAYRCMVCGERNLYVGQ